ncbi:MAG: DNA polymerase III subunit delta [Iphinoe sp. HA4291-MV1]|jgi:DNA polymerase-3 subunit delta|nr:DNA polymerase III subunit delta [Iphinoe sp. HA4291-MV1]
MPVYFYWGEDDFAMEKAIALMRDRVLDPLWTSFNYTVLPPDLPDVPIQALNQVMTPPFGAGGRLVWLANTTLCQQCSDNVLSELERTLPVIPKDSYLLLTSSHKPDERLKSTKIFKKFAEFREFSLIPPWKTELLMQSVSQAAQTVGVKLTPKSVEMLVDAVGNDTRLLYNELEKLRLYAQSSNQPLDTDAVAQLVRNTSQNSLQLAAAIRTGDTARALAILTNIINACEPPLRIVATLIGQFRTWLWIKLMIESGERNPLFIAKAAEIGNPNRIYYLQKEIQSVSVEQLIATLPILLDLEVSLKQGASEMSILQIKVIELCQVCRGT